MLLVVTALASFTPAVARADAGPDAAGATCSADRTTSISADGNTKINCSPFLCSGDGLCPSTCGVDGDCAEGFKCDTAHDKCVKPDPDAANSNTSAFCAYGHSESTPFLFAVAMLGFLRRR
jgi:hypothetical protein